MGCYTSKCEKNQNHCTLVHMLRAREEGSPRTLLGRRGGREVRLSTLKHGNSL
jgi:hypothetical protein